MAISLAPELETQLQAYEAHIFKNGPPAILLETEVCKYFDQWGHDPDRVDALFNRFATIWGILYQLHHFAEADAYWDTPLYYAEKWENMRQKRLHKGTPYYFRAMAVVAGGNIDRGFLYFHQALEEDELTTGRPVSSGPAWSFVTLDFVNVYQAALQLVRSRADWLDQRLSAYRATGRGSLSLGGLRTNVLNQPQLKDATFSFTHAVFRSEHLFSLAQQFRSSQFASQLELDTLNSFCRIAEVWLKDRQPPSNRHERQLGGQLLRFFQNQKWSLTHDDLRKVMAADFEAKLAAILDGQQGPLPRCYLSSQADLVLIYVLRNQASHEVTSSAIICRRFPEFVERVLFGLFVIGEKLF